MIFKVLIYLLIYLLSLWRMYWWHQHNYYHPDGVSYGEDPNPLDYFMTFVPYANTLGAIFSMFLPWTTVEIRCKSKKSSNNIFKPRKPFNTEDTYAG